MNSKFGHKNKTINYFKFVLHVYESLFNICINYIDKNIKYIILSID